MGHFSASRPNLLIKSEIRIKKAYRKRALELHPDRNFGDVEKSTKLFTEIQSAYDVLSDPHERAWYDSHRDAILQNDTSENEGQYEHNVRVTTTEAIMKMYVDFSGRFEFSDSPSGFFSIMREVFDRLAHEENIACEWAGQDEPNYPSFGYSKDIYETTVKAFYTTWSSFATTKSFSWKDAYRYSEAPDRRTRRMMEKENRHLREDGIREFNEAVRALVAFVKKRDPRYVPKTQTEEERQQMLRNVTATQAAKSRAANQVKFSNDAVGEWTRVKEMNEEYESDESEEDIREQFDCMICNKSFKSENQYKAHEQSKKHIKAVHNLQKQMKKEDSVLGLHASNDVRAGRNGSDATSVGIEDEALLHETGSRHVSDKKDQEIEPPSDDISKSEDIHEEDSSQGSCDDPLSRKESGRHALGRATSLELTPNYIVNGTTINIKKGKAKEKRDRKAAQEATQKLADFKCLACLAEFPSKTRLFDHIKDFGHAQPIDKMTNGRIGRNKA